MRINLLRALAVIIAVLMVLALTVPSFAHETREVGSATFVVGFLTEPAFEGQANAASVRVTSTGSGEPITGLEETLQIEITHPSTGEVLTSDLDTRFGDPGHYVRHFVPTAPGQYQFRVFGEIDGTPVDETFTSGPGTFNHVESLSEIQFPLTLASGREVENAARGAQESADRATQEADSAGSTATLAMVFGIVGIGVGVTGVGLGLWGLQAARKR